MDKTRICKLEGCTKPLKPSQESYCGEEHRDLGARRKRKATIRGYRYVSRPGHPLAPRSGLVPEHRMILYDRIGPGPHPCHICGGQLEWRKDPYAADNVFADHLDDDITNNAPENLAPAHRTCNRLRGEGTSLIRADEPVYVFPSGVRTRGVWRVCEYDACAAPFIALPAHVRAGKGRFHSPECVSLWMGSAARERRERSGQ